MNLLQARFPQAIAVGVMLVVALAACDDAVSPQASSSPTHSAVGDGLVTMSFRGARYDGYEEPTTAQLIATPLGSADSFSGPIAGPDVLSIQGLDPSREVVMKARDGLPFAYVIFVEHWYLLTGGDRPFGAVFRELCPFVTSPELRSGCPGTSPSPPPEGPG